MDCCTGKRDSLEDGTSGEAEADEHKKRMLQLAEDALRRAELEQAKEFVEIDGEEVANVTTPAEPLHSDQAADAGGRLSKFLRQRTFFVNHGASIQDNLSKRGFGSYNIHTVDDWRMRVQKATGAHFLTIPTLDGRTLDGYMVAPRGLDNNACAILFHANAMICLDMALWAKWYSVRGVTALAVTMGGYAESSAVTTSELTTYFDAQAALDYALTNTGLPIDRVIAHGLSIGGALASAVAAVNPGLNCTVDQTFVNATEVAVTCAKEFNSKVPTFLVKASVGSMFKSGVQDQRLAGYVTDQYDNERKAALVQGNYFVFWAFEDQMMLPEYALRLYQAWSDKYDMINDSPQETTEEGFDVISNVVLGARGMRDVNKRVAMINGGHCSFFGHDPPASRKYENYLSEIWGLKLRGNDSSRMQSPSTRRPL